MSDATAAPDPLVAAFQAAEAMPEDAARQRLAELLWYAAHNIALPDEELDEVAVLAARLGVRLRWRRLELGKHGGEWSWRDE